MSLKACNEKLPAAKHYTHNIELSNGPVQGLTTRANKAEKVLQKSIEDVALFEDTVAEKSS